MFLLVPLDVANTRNNGGLDMKSFWYTILMTSAIFIFIVLPTAMFFYEAEGDAMVSLIRLTSSEISNLACSQTGIFLLDHRLSLRLHLFWIHVQSQYSNRHIQV